jgi:uncharacterized protein (TIGR02246 family)
MRKSLLGLGIVAALLLIASARNGEGQASATDDERAIRQAVAAYADAFNKGDLAALAAFWAADAEYVAEDGTITKGRDAIAGLFRPFFTEADRKGSRITLEVTSVHVLKGDVALQDGNSAITGPDGTASQGRYTAVWSKSDGKWQIHRARDLPYGPDESPGASGPLKELQWLVGQWEGDKGNVRVDVRWTLDRAFLAEEYKAKRGEGELSVQQLIGFDPLTGRIKSWYFDSRGNYGEGLWQRDGNSWRVQTAGVLGNGQTGTGVNVLRYVDDQSLVFQSRDREIGGQPIPDAEVTLTRKAAAK